MPITHGVARSISWWPGLRIMRVLHRFTLVRVTDAEPAPHGPGCQTRGKAIRENTQTRRGAHCGAPLRCGNETSRYESRLDRAGFADGAVPPSVTGAIVVQGADDDDGFGGRGGLPAMMSPIWSESIVSSSSSSFAITLALSRISAVCLRASPYCWSMMPQITASTLFIVSSDMFTVRVMARPRNISPSLSP